MVPSLRHGDLLLVSGRARIRPGDVVVGQFRSMPGLLVVKRAQRPCEAGWWLTSDNAFAAGDSAAHGVADVAGRVLLRWRPGRRALSRVRRVAPDSSGPS